MTETLTAEQIKAARAGAGLNQWDFAARVGCSRNQLQVYEKNGLPARMNRLVRANLLRAAKRAKVTA